MPIPCHCLTSIHAQAPDSHLNPASDQFQYLTAKPEITDPSRDQICFLSTCTAINQQIRPLHHVGLKIRIILNITSLNGLESGHVISPGYDKIFYVHQYLMR